MGINANMLVPVHITKKISLKDKNSAHLHMGLLNAQSIWDKDGAIVDYILCNNINITIITESWLQCTEEDACRLNTSEFNTGLFSAIPSNRQDRTGGAILLVHKKSYKADLIGGIFTFLSSCQVQGTSGQVQHHLVCHLSATIFHSQSNH